MSDILTGTMIRQVVVVLWGLDVLSLVDFVISVSHEKLSIKCNEKKRHQFVIPYCKFSIKTMVFFFNRGITV